MAAGSDDSVYLALPTHEVGIEADPVCCEIKITGGYTVLIEGA